MWQNKKLQNNGYTIVEALIFLAVSALIAISALTLLNGRQTKAEFTEAINSFEAQLRDVANDVTVGYFPNPGLECSPAATGVNVASASIDQGTDADCVFVARAIQFKNSSMDIYTALGKRQAGGLEVESVFESEPTLVVDMGGSEPDITETVEISPAIEVAWVRYGGVDQSGVTFFTTFGNGNVTSNSATIRSLISPVSGDLTTDKNAFINNFHTFYRDEANEPTYNTYINSGESVEICANSGGVDQHAIIRLGARGGGGSSSIIEYGNGMCS